MSRNDSILQTQVTDLHCQKLEPLVSAAVKLLICPWCIQTPTKLPWCCLIRKCFVQPPSWKSLEKNTWLHLVGRTIVYIYGTLSLKHRRKSLTRSFLRTKFAIACSHLRWTKTPSVTEKYILYLMEAEESSSSIWTQTNWPSLQHWSSLQHRTYGTCVLPTWKMALLVYSSVFPMTTMSWLWRWPPGKPDGRQVRNRWGEIWPLEHLHRWKQHCLCRWLSPRHDSRSFRRRRHVDEKTRRW